MNRVIELLGMAMGIRSSGRDRYFGPHWITVGMGAQCLSSVMQSVKVIHFQRALNLLQFSDSIESIATQTASVSVVGLLLTGDKSLCGCHHRI